MSADDGLREALRALKLSGMLDTLDARLAQARAGELGHLEFLQVLCQDEVARRDQAAFEDVSLLWPHRDGLLWLHRGRLAGRL